MSASRPRPLPLAAMILLGVLGLALLAPAAAGDDPATQVKDLHARYEALQSKKGHTAFTARMDAIRDLAKLDHAAARKALLKIAGDSKVVDDRALAVLGLGRRLDLATARALAAIVAKRPVPVLVQALGDAFSGADGEAVLTWLATDALEHTSPAVAQAALDAQYAHADPRALKRAVALYDAWHEKRDGMAIAHAAVRALGSINGRPVRTFLLRAAEHADWRVRLAVADVMAWQQPYDVNVRGTLKDLLTDDEPVVRQRAAASIGEARMEELLPDVAARLEDPHIKTRAVAHTALRALSHRDLGYDPRDWLLWWKRRSTTRGGLKPSPSSSVVTYYGVNVHSDRLIFVVDISGSMAMPRVAGKARIDVARRELRRALGNLDEKTLFNVIVFSDKVRAWRRGEVLATKANLVKARTWVDKALTDPQGGTYMAAALEKAFAENPRMDTVYLLTDGLASDGEPIVPEAILQSVGGWNRYRRVVIHTFALTLEDEFPDGLPDASLDPVKRFMRDLAKATGGTCTVVTKAP